MAKVKPRPVRLVDILNILDDNDMAIVMFKYNTRPTHSNYVKNLKVQLDMFLGAEIVGITDSGAITFLINA